jgi:hypothetical protein
MASGENAIKTNGKEWWGKRPLSGLSVKRKTGMKFWKRLLHKKERIDAKLTVTKWQER